VFQAAEALTEGSEELLVVAAVEGVEEAREVGNLVNHCQDLWRVNDLPCAAGEKGQPAGVARMQACQEAERKPLPQANMEPCAGLRP